MGEGVAADPLKAANFFRQAAEKGDPQGQYGYGRALEFGNGVDQNTAAAREWYRTVLDNPDADADTKKDATDRIAILGK